MVYQQCGSLCPQTCDTIENEECGGGCVEGCFCPSGTVLSNNHCVDVTECQGIIIIFVQSLCLYMCTSGAYTNKILGCYFV